MDKRFVDEVFDELAEEYDAGNGEDIFADVGFEGDEFEEDRFQDYLDEMIEKDLDMITQPTSFKAYSDFDEYEHHFTTSASIPSCEPGQFESGKLRVVQWPNRTTPGRRDIPKDLNLAILSRGRIRLPFENIRWLLTGAETKCGWIARLPPDIDASVPEVDVTLELFITQYFLTDEEISNILIQWLRNRVATELTDCAFFAFKWTMAENKLDITKKLRLRDFGLTLDSLYKKAGVAFSKPTGREEADFILNVYVTFPKDLEKYLNPPQPCTNEEKRKELAKRILKVTDKIEAADPDPVRKKRVLCMLRKLTDNIVDGREVDDSYLVFPNRLPLRSKRLTLNVMEQLIGKYLGVDDSTFIRGINTIYRDIMNPITRLYGELQAVLIEFTSDPIRGISKYDLLRENEECKRAAYFLKKAKDPRSIYSCFRSWILGTFKECDRALFGS